MTVVAVRCYVVVRLVFAVVVVGVFLSVNIGQSYFVTNIAVTRYN